MRFLVLVIALYYLQSGDNRMNHEGHEITRRQSAQASPNNTQLGTENEDIVQLYWARFGRSPLQWRWKNEQGNIEAIGWWSHRHSLNQTNPLFVIQQREKPIYQNSPGLVMIGELESRKCIPLARRIYYIALMSPRDQAIAYRLVPSLLLDPVGFSHSLMPMQHTFGQFDIYEWERNIIYAIWNVNLIHIIHIRRILKQMRVCCKLL